MKHVGTGLGAHMSTPALPLVLSPSLQTVQAPPYVVSVLGALGIDADDTGPSREVARRIACAGPIVSLVREGGLAPLIARLERAVGPCLHAAHGVAGWGKKVAVRR